MIEDIQGDESNDNNEEEDDVVELEEGDEDE